MNRTRVPELTKHLRRVLGKAQEERDARPDLVTLPSGGVECAWAAFERSVMHREVNRLRVEGGLESVPVEEVMKVEVWACGHADYTAKFALYCAELALGLEGGGR